MFTYRSVFTVCVPIIIFKEVGSKNSFGRNFTPDCHFRAIERLRTKLIRVISTPIPHIMFVYMARKVKICFIRHDYQVRQIWHLIFHCQYFSTENYSLVEVLFFKFLNSFKSCKEGNGDLDATFFVEICWKSEVPTLVSWWASLVFDLQ